MGKGFLVAFMIVFIVCGGLVLGAIGRQAYEERMSVLSRIEALEKQADSLQTGLQGAVLVKGDIWADIFTTLHRDYLYAQQMQPVRPQNKALGSPEE